MSEARFKPKCKLQSIRVLIHKLQLESPGELFKLLMPGFHLPQQILITTSLNVTWESGYYLKFPK